MLYSNGTEPAFASLEQGEFQVVAHSQRSLLTRDLPRSSGIFQAKCACMHACMRHVLAYTSSRDLRNTKLAGVERGRRREREEEGGGMF